MKTKLIYSILILNLFAINVNATKFIITQTDFTFSPSVLNDVKVGDTIRFVWTSGTHTTTSTTVPVGAATWDSPLTSAVQQFDYKVTVSGDYSYECSIHASMGMTGSFKVEDILTIIGSYGIPDPVELTVYPNPASDYVNFDITEKSLAGGELIIFNATGSIIRNVQFDETASNGKLQLNIADLPKGMYYVQLSNNAKSKATKPLIKL